MKVNEDFHLSTCAVGLGGTRQGNIERFSRHQRIWIQDQLVYGEFAASCSCDTSVRSRVEHVSRSSISPVATRSRTHRTASTTHLLVQVLRAPVGSRETRMIARLVSFSRPTSCGSIVDGPSTRNKKIDTLPLQPISLMAFHRISLEDLDVFGF